MAGKGPSPRFGFSDRGRSTIDKVFPRCQWCRARLKEEMNYLQKPDGDMKGPFCKPCFEGYKKK